MIAMAQQTEPHRRLWTKEEYYRLGELGFFRGQKVELLDGEIWIQYPDDHLEARRFYPSQEPHRRLWTKDEFYRLGELGFFHGQKAELLGGEIMVASPQSWQHASHVSRAGKVLDAALGANARVRTQLPLDFGLVVEPEPDVSVVPGSIDDYSAHPSTALLVVEVSESTLVYDRSDKASLYARAGISDYWIVNLVHQQLEVYRDPAPDPTQQHGYGYSTTVVLKPPASVAPLAAPGVSIPVADLLP